MVARSQRRTPMLEWVAAALGLSIVLATLASLAWQTVRRDDATPVLEVAVERIAVTSAGYVVEIEVRNRSGATAAGVEIESTLTTAGAAPVSSRLTVDFVPAHSARRAGLLIERDPRNGRLELRVLGYVEP